jgi:putative serine protease PepD
MTDGQFSSDGRQSGDYSEYPVGQKTDNFDNTTNTVSNPNPTEPINSQNTQPTQSAQTTEQMPFAQNTQTTSAGTGYTGYTAHTTQVNTAASGQHSAYKANYGAHTATSSFAGSASASANPSPSASSADYAASVIPVGTSDAGVKKSGAGKTFVVAFAGALIACVLAFGVASATGLIGKSVTLGSSSSSSITSTDDTETTLATEVADKCLPSVVSINVYTDSSTSSSSSIYDFLNGSNSNSGSTTYTLSSRGSGIVLSSDGYILTNYHVVANGKKFEAVIDGSTLEATLVGSDSSSDVAVLKVDGSGYTAIEIGDSDNIQVGEWVMTIGSPFGLEQSVATGIISNTSRSQIIDQSSLSSSGITTALIYPNLIQTDAAINPGNSGGALVNAEGKLIGINTLITTYSGNYSGVGFAIPSNYAIDLAQEIIEGKTTTHAYLGVTTSTVSAEAAARYNFSVTSGAYVSSVAEGSGAAKAGIQVGDIITGFDGKTVSSTSNLLLDVRTKSPGDTVTITLNRNGVEMQVQATLGSDQEAAAAASSSSSTNSYSQNSSPYNQSQSYTDETTSISTDSLAA